MASAVELFESREGDTSGVFGDANTRSFKVTVDAETDDPAATLRGLQTGGVPTGSLHPKSGRNGIVSLIYTQGFRWTTLQWTVHVLYGPPIFFATEQNYWEIAIRGNGEQEFVFHDLDGKPIGKPEYQKITELTSPPQGEETFKTSVIDENGDVQDQDVYVPWLSDPKKRIMFLEGATRFRRGGDVLLQRNFAVFPQAIDSVLAAIRTVNSDTVRVRIADFSEDIPLGPPGHFALANADIHPVPGQLVGQIIPNRIWQATVQLQYSAIPWNPYTLRHTFRSGATETQITDSSGNAIEDDFRLNTWANFTSLLKAFEPGSTGGLTTQGDRFDVPGGGKGGDRP